MRRSAPGHSTCQSGPSRVRLASEAPRRKGRKGKFPPCATAFATQASFAPRKPHSSHFRVLVVLSVQLAALCRSFVGLADIQTRLNSRQPRSVYARPRAARALLARSRRRRAHPARCQRRLARPSAPRAMAARTSPRPMPRHASHASLGRSALLVLQRRCHARRVASVAVPLSRASRSARLARLARRASPARSRRRRACRALCLRCLELLSASPVPMATTSLWRMPRAAARAHARVQQTRSWSVTARSSRI